MNPGVAGGHVELARKLEDLPESLEALGAGEISGRPRAGHSPAPTHPNGRGTGRARTAARRRGRTTTTRTLSHRSLRDRRDRRRWRRRQRRHRPRAPTVAHVAHDRRDMLKLDGLVDPEDAEYWENTVNAEVDREYFEGDTRLLSQRRADAATNLVRRSLDAGEVGNSRAVRPHLSIVADLDALPGTTPELVAHGAHRSPRPGASPQPPSNGSAATVTSAVSSPAVDPRCSTSVVRPAPISAALWKALVVHDRHCTAPGCNQAPERCEAHHRRHWSRGGPTNLGNLELLCWHHHRHRHTETPSPAPPDRDPPTRRKYPSWPLSAL